MAVIYKGFYKDSAGTRAIEIKNDFNKLTTVIDGIVFSGSEFSDLCIIDKSKYTTDQLERFSFLSSKVYQTNLIQESLCNCSFELVAPQVIIDKLNNVELQSDLKIEYSLGRVVYHDTWRCLEHERMALTLTIVSDTYTGTGDYFEGALDSIRDQMKDKYHFKNCYGCMYGDYSVYGQSSFGSMCCFMNQKEQYHKVTNKEEYMELEYPVRNVQEIYCCDQYEIRKKGAGYRG